jgi:hypothetical protein
MRFISFFLGIVILCNADNAFSQTVGISNSSTRVPEYKYLLSNNNVSSNVRLNEISTRAFRSFSKSYPDVSAEIWTKTANGLAVSFNLNSKNYKVFYGKNGHFLYSLIYYEGSSCANELTKAIAETNTGFHINNVVEVFDGNKLRYGLTISNDQFYRDMEYHDGEMKMLEEYKLQP